MTTPYRRHLLPVLLTLLAVLGSLLAIQAPPAAAASGTLLRDGTGLYPRAVRLQHNGAANGRVLASVVTFRGSDGIGAIYESTDDGATFRQVG
ncbi:hypothetical protein ACFY8S_16565 [Streptomyces hygroscopicus]